MVKGPLLLTTLMTTLSSVYSAKILAVFPLGAKSHHRFLQPAAMTLARAGHQVVLYSPFPDLPDDQSTNLTHVHMQNIPVVHQSAEMNEFIKDVTEFPFWKCLDLQWSLTDDFYGQVLGDDKFKKLLSSDEKFDLIITETFTAQEFIAHLLSKKFKVPVIGLQAFPTNPLINSFFGNSLSLSYIPDICTSFSTKMTFIERFANAFAKLRGLYYHYNYFLPKVENMMNKDFPDASIVEELTNSVSLMFVNDHLTADYAQPRTPNIIPVGGIHIQPLGSLPENLQKFMDEAKHGVIYFSLGTYVLDELQPDEYFVMYNNVFKNLKQRIIWKTRKENVPGLPSNVMTLKWAPQNEILAHPACVLFITHGGQLSRVEAIHFGVPVVSIAQFYDQHSNSEFYEHKGVGVKLARQDVSEETMRAAINKVLQNPSYRDNMKRLSAIFRDRPLSPAESVVFWTEYVLRHNGAAHLRPASTELTWYQLILLDVIASILFTLVMLFVVLLFVLKRGCQLFRKRKLVPTTKKNN